MERRIAVRHEQLMAEAVVKPEALEGVLTRLDEFVKPFAASLKHDAQRQHAAEYVTGLVSHVKRKNIESIAYLHEQDRQPLQKFIGQKPWEWTTTARGTSNEHPASPLRSTHPPQSPETDRTLLSLEKTQTLTTVEETTQNLTYTVKLGLICIAEAIESSETNTMARPNQTNACMTRILGTRSCSPSEPGNCGRLSILHAPDDASETSYERSRPSIS